MILPVLFFEDTVQVNDLTRFDASKSVLVKGSQGNISSVKIRPGATASEIDVFNAVQKNWFLDWVFTDLKFDVDDTNNRIDFMLNENDAPAALIPAGSYTTEELIGEIEDALIAAGVADAEVSFDEWEQITIEGTGLKLLPKYKPEDLLQHLGFTKRGQKTGTPVEYVLKKVSLTIVSGTGESQETATKDYYVEVYSPEGDALFSCDADLTAEEPDIMKWLPQGRTSYMDLHRKAQRLILDWLDRKGYRDTQGNKLTKFAVLDKSDVNTWSYYTALRLFFNGNSNAKDDVFKEKAKEYAKHEAESRDRFTLSLDLNNDKKPDAQKGPDIATGRILFR